MFTGLQHSYDEKRRPSVLAWPLIVGIYAYRYTFGPLFAGSCRHYPSCSQYAEEALRKHGAWSGSMLSIKRLSRCHPWRPGGFDPVP